MKAECTACGHDILIPAVGLLQGLRLPPYTYVLDLERKLRGRECDALGKAVVSIKWAAGLDQRRRLPLLSTRLGTYGFFGAGGSGFGFGSSLARVSRMGFRAGANGYRSAANLPRA